MMISIAPFTLTSRGRRWDKKDIKCANLLWKSKRIAVDNVNEYEFIKLASTHFCSVSHNMNDDTIATAPLSFELLVWCTKFDVYYRPFLQILPGNHAFSVGKLLFLLFLMIWEHIILVNCTGIHRQHNRSSEIFASEITPHYSERHRAKCRSISCWLEASVFMILPVLLALISK